MNTRTVAKRTQRIPSFFEDFFNKPLLDLFDSGLSSRRMSVPAVNITERKDDYLVSMAAPGLKKEDFKIDVEGNLLTISSEKEEENEEKSEKYTRQEYSYSSFERSFTLPDEVNKDQIDARYQDGVLELVLPKKEEAKKMAISKKIAVK
jgi:HSP20 family protein